MVDEVLAALAPQPGDVVVDATAGRGGHALAIAQAMGGEGTLILNDADAGNLAFAAARVAEAFPSLTLVSVHGNFAALPHALRERSLRARALLADLGFASNQVETASRGFSFQRDGPLDMRLDQSLPFSAQDLVNSAPEDELAHILSTYGEERHARRIARRIATERKVRALTTTAQLAELVKAALPASHDGIHPATRTFQALRIAVNDELGSLEALLAALAPGRWGSWCEGGCRVAIISFHSLEDRLVKRAFAEWQRAGAARAITDGCVEASEQEASCNPRSRSAKLRATSLVVPIG